ncbi:MAG: AraC family transcriptional regulator [Pedobacter sp.]|nr:MAG: AraC family transcriptional regulator [Pedobacter sp.]
MQILSTMDTLKLSHQQTICVLHDYILFNLDNPLLDHLEELSKKFFISTKTMNRLFKKQFASTIHAFIQEQRLLAAHEYLKLGNLVSEAASMVGYQYTESFSRAFKKRFGVSPKHVRADEKFGSFSEAG